MVKTINIPKGSLCKTDIQFITEYADKYHDGHFTIMKFTTNYKVSFGYQPSSRQEIDEMATGDSLFDAAMKAISK